jgi:hypothetical protein
VSVAKRKRELQAMALTVAAQANARLLNIQRTGRGHWRLVFAKAGKGIAMYAAATPSDNHRDMKNNISQARRALKELRR